MTVRKSRKNKEYEDRMTQMHYYNDGNNINNVSDNGSLNCRKISTVNEAAKTALSYIAQLPTALQITVVFYHLHNVY